MTPFTDTQAERIEAAGGIVFDAASRIGAWVKTDSLLNVFPQPGYLGHNSIDLTRRTEAFGPLRTAFHAHAVLPGPVSIARSVHRGHNGRPAILVTTRGSFGAPIGHRTTDIRVLYTMDEAVEYAIAESASAIAAAWRPELLRVRTVWRPNGMAEDVLEIAPIDGRRWARVTRP